MKKQLTISKGHQYSRDGYRTSGGQYGEIAERMDGTVGITVSNGMLLGYDYNHSGQREMVEQAIREVIADGVARTVTLMDRVEAGIDTAQPAVAPSPARVHGVNGWCDKCRSYCYGDCTGR